MPSHYPYAYDDGVLGDQGVHQSLSPEEAAYYTTQQSGQSRTAQPRGGAPSVPGGTASNGFFDDPLLSWVEGFIRDRIDTLGQPTDNSYLDPLRNILFGGSGSGDGDDDGGDDSVGPGGPAPDPLGAFADFVSGFGSGATGALSNYAAGTNPFQFFQGLADYAGGRDPQAASAQLLDLLQGLGPDTSISDLQEYLANRDSNAPVTALEEFLAGFDPLSGYQESLASRLEELRGDPFNDEILAARRVGAFDEMDRDREITKQRRAEELAASGVDSSSGLFQREMADIDRRFDSQRATAQNRLVQEEFQIREQRMAQADALEAQAAQLQLQSDTIAANITTQIAQLQQQGMSMEDSLATSLAQLGITQRGQQQQIMVAVAQLTQQGFQMQDALQMSLAQVGLQAQQQADALRIAIAQTGVQESGIAADLQSALAGYRVGMRGQDLQHEAAMAAASASGSAANLGAMMQWAQLERQLRLDEQNRQSQIVDWALVLNSLGREGIADLAPYFGGG